MRPYEPGNESPTFMKGFRNRLIDGKFHSLAGLIKLSLTQNDDIPGK